MKPAVSGKMPPQSLRCLPPSRATAHILQHPPRKRDCTLATALPAGRFPSAGAAAPLGPLRACPAAIGIRADDRRAA